MAKKKGAQEIKGGVGGGREVDSGSGTKAMNKTFVHPLEAKLNGGTIADVPQWNCAMCTFANRGNAPKCEMCGCPKDAH